jgi:two-component system, response regulator PdtaR
MVILVVEDDRLLNLVASDDLERSGYEVISAFDADQAIDILESRDDIRLLFTDIDMPGSMDGLKLMAAVRDRWPPIPIIVTSGKHAPCELPERTSFVPKPYRAEHVLQTIAALV